MNLDPLVIALQGLGFGQKLTALQGLVAFQKTDEDEEVLVMRPAPKRERKKKDPRRDTDDDAIFLFLLN